MLTVKMRQETLEDSDVDDGPKYSTYANFLRGDDRQKYEEELQVKKQNLAKNRENVKAAEKLKNQFKDKLKAQL